MKMATKKKHISLMVIFLIAILAFFVDRLIVSSEEKQNYYLLESKILDTYSGTNIETFFMTNFQNVLALKGLYEQSEKISNEQFLGFARKLTEGNRFIQALEFISRDFKIERVSPIKGNENLIGLALKSSSDVTMETALKAASLVGTEREAVALSDPFVTRKGNRGIVIVAPVIRNTLVHGYSATLINLDLLTASLRHKEMRSEVDFSFRIGNIWLQEPYPHAFYRERKFIIYDKEIVLGAGTNGGFIPYKRILIGYAWLTLIAGFVAYFRHVSRESSKLISEISVISKERSNIEMLMERILDSSRLGVAVFDRSGIIIMHNRHMGTILNIDGSATGKNLFDLDIPESLRDSCRETLKKIPGQVESFEVAFKQDNRVIWYNCLLCCPQVDEQNYFYLVSQDITMNKRLLQDRYENQKMETVGQLAAGIAHDFNNILSASSGYIEILEEKMGAGEHAEALSYISNIGKMNDRATGLVSKLLGYARRGKTEAIVFDLKEIVSTLIEMCRNTFPKEIELKSSLPLEKLRVLGDPNQIESAILNILINARDSIKDRGTLKISGEIKNLREMKSAIGVLPSSERFIEIALSDTGMGMSEDVLGKIFEPFFSTKRDEGGSGLGLSMCYGIMKSHGGYVFADSIKGQGSTFTLYLPLLEEEMNTPIADNDENPPLIASGSGTHVLVIDDEEDIIKFLKEALQSKGYRATCITNCQDGLEFFKNNSERVDMVLLDYSMPKMTGVECAEKMKEIRSHVGIILMSGYSEEQLINRVIESGTIDGFLKKPFKLNDLFRALSRKI
jgi:nitrogen-specific signal transduction histidine kinase/CheY-like chemotaxis protein